MIANVRVWASAAFLIGCYGQSHAAPLAAAQAGAVPPERPAPASIAPAMPDVGKLETVPVRAEGHGQTAAEAVDEAIKSAILQANGTSLDMSSAQLRAAISVGIGKDEIDLRSSAFAQAVVQHSQGAVTNFEIGSLRKDSGGEYIAAIVANVAKFAQPASARRVRVVVAPIRVHSSAYQIGDSSVPAEQLALQLRQQVINELTQTERFTVLEREFTAELADELNLVSSGAAPTGEFAKLGQALSADLIWVATIDSLGCEKHVRQLQTSDRQLVSYAGGTTLSHRLINVATRQIVFSDSVTYELPPIGPTTLGAPLDARGTIAQLESGVTAKIIPEIVTRMFPVTVISRDGNSVVLSQGGKILREHALYQLVVTGDELRDPQTGESLGRTERPCCLVRIDQVAPTLSYGTLQDLSMNLGQTAPGALQLRQLVSAQATAVAADRSSDRASQPAQSPAGLGSGARPPLQTAKPVTAPADIPSAAKDKNW